MNMHDSLERRQLTRLLKIESSVAWNRTMSVQLEQDRSNQDRAQSLNGRWNLERESVQCVVTINLQTNGFT